MGRGMAAKGKKRPRKASPPEALVAGDGKEGPGGGGGFFCCYLLRSLCPGRKGHTYIGFTVNPRRRIRQHNGEIRCGAWRTKRGRPWEMVLCIYGFPTNVSALQFEWAWQHPTKSLAVRKAASIFKSFGGIGNKVKLAYTMLNLPSWENLNLTVNFFSTENTKLTAGCPALPSHMKTVVCPMEDIQCYAEGLLSEEDNDSSDEPQENQEPGMPVRDEHSHHGSQQVEGDIRIAGCEPSIDEFAAMEWSGTFRARELGRSRSTESSEVQQEEEIRTAGCDAECSIDEFTESSEVQQEEEIRTAGCDAECSIDKFTESTEVQQEEEIRTAGCDAECSIDEFTYMEWSGIRKTRELGGLGTSPRCSSNSWSDGDGGRIADGLLRQLSPMSRAGASSSDDGDHLFHERDVVDLVTPVGRLGRKGGEVATICPKIIDLTSSPIIIEL